jgi:four helix bundle protein
MGNFKNLLVWQKAKDLCVKIYKLTESGKIKNDFGLKDQMRRASVSIPSNVAEGDGLDTDKQSVRHFFIARGSVSELRTQLIIACEIGYLAKELYEELENDCAQISAMITSLIKHRSS